MGHETAQLDATESRAGSGRGDIVLAHGTMKSPVGRLTVLASEAGVVAVLFEKSTDESPAVLAARYGGDIADDDSATAAHSMVTRTMQELDEYFRGERREFDVPVHVTTGTDFQRRVWSTLREVPFGHTTNYGDIARRIGQPTASRAVGAANGQNSVSIIVPCHRIIGSTGAPVGYGGGLARKGWLLEHEAQAG